MIPDMTGLTLKQRQQVIRDNVMAAQAASDAPLRHEPADYAAASPRLMEGYNSRAVDEVTWAKIAFHLAAGVPIIKIAEHYKLSRTTIWRALSQSSNLRRRIAEERALIRREADSRFVAMRELVVDTLYRAVADGNMRATIWAAERLGIGDTLLQQAETPPKPGYARIPQSWWPTDAKAAAMQAEIERPPGPDKPLPVMEESPAPGSPTGLRPPGPIRPASITTSPPPNPQSSSSRRKPGPRGHTPDLSAQTVPAPTDAPERDGVENEAPDTQPRAPSAHPAAPAPTPKRRAATRPVPRPATPTRRPGPIRPPRASIRLLAWLLHNSLPTADGEDGVRGLTAARLVAHARWLAMIGGHKTR